MKISDIKISQEELEKFKKLSAKYQYREFRGKYMCNSCNQLAIKKVTYQFGDKEQKITRIEKYCQRHFELIIKR